MEFKKYNSIENSYQEKVLEQIIIHGFEKEIYIVQEKVHGANFSIYTDGKTIKIAKRTDFIQEDEPFYNAHAVLKKYKENILELFTAVKKQFAATAYIVIYGELFGGSYNHKDVKSVKEMIKVQKGIDYSPENDLYAFDIKINGADFLEVEAANDLFEQTNFFYAKTLFKGSIDEALKFPNDFNSKIPEWLRLPLLDNNIAEGTIIKSAKPIYFKNGSRLILKNKNEKWSEKAKGNTNKKPRIKNSFSTDAQLVWEIIETFVTTNRLQNVLSKIGEFHPKIMGKVTGLFAQDVLTDYLKEQAEAFHSLEKEEQKMIKKQLNAAVVKVIKEEYFTMK